MYGFYSTVRKRRDMLSFDGLSATITALIFAPAMESGGDLPEKFSR